MSKPIHPVLSKVARAIWDVGAADDMSHPASLMYARAAIQALLEPDEGEIRKVGNRLYKQGMISGVVTDDLMIRTAYTAMLKPLLGDEG